MCLDPLTAGWGTAKMQVTICSSHLQSGLSQEPCLYIAKVLTLNGAGGAGSEWIKHTLVAKQQDCQYKKASATPCSQAVSTKRPELSGSEAALESCRWSKLNRILYFHWFEGAKENSFLISLYSCS